MQLLQKQREMRPGESIHCEIAFCHHRQQAVFLNLEPMIALSEQIVDASRQRAHAYFIGRSVIQSKSMEDVAVADQIWRQ